MMSYKFWMPAMAAMVVGVLLATSCSTTPTTPPASVPTSKSQPAASPTPAKPSGTLVVGWSREVTAPINTHGAAGSGLGSAVFDSFLSRTPEGQLGPGLAERWEISSDGRTHTFYLRKGVKFHDGSELTGEDAKFSLERIVDPKVVHLSSYERANWPKQIDSIEVKDGYTVILHLKQPQYQALYGFDRPGLTTSSMILPKKYIQANGEDYFATHPMGSGAWKVVKFEPGVRLELEANEGYWGTVPKFKNLTILDVKETATAIAMLKTGELDLAEVGPDSVPGLKAAGIRTVSFAGNSQFAGWGFYDLDNPDKHPFGNVKVRKALSLAVDRKQLANSLFAGYAKPAYGFQLMDTAYYFDPNQMKPDPYDPDQAKKLLADAGYPNGVSLKVWDSGGGGLETTVAQALAGYWQKIGVNPEMSVIEYATVTKMRSTKPVQPGVWNSFQALITGGNIWQDESFATLYHSKGSSNNINNPELDKLIDKLPLVSDAAERKRMAVEIAIKAKEEYGCFGFLDLDTILAVGPKIGEIAPIKGGSRLWGPMYATITRAK